MYKSLKNSLIIAFNLLKVHQISLKNDKKYRIKKKILFIYNNKIKFIDINKIKFIYDNKIKFIF